MPIRLGESFSFDQRLPAGAPSGPIVAEAHTRVAVLGAGLAGLACAFRLTEGGRRHMDRRHVVVLEREAQPGGRTRSLQIEGSVVNLGAVTFQPAHYQHYMALLAELGLTDRVRIVPRRRMIFGYDGRATRADTLSLAWDTVKGLVGRGVYSPGEAAQLLRFYFFLRRVTAPENEAEFNALHELSVANWARTFGFDDALQRKFVRPLTHYCFRGPEDVSAAFGVFLLGFNLSQPATLLGGFGQVADDIASRLGRLLETTATALEVTRTPDGFAIIYHRAGELYRLHAKRLVVAVPASVAAALLPEMRARAERVTYGGGSGLVVAGEFRDEVALQLRVRAGPQGLVIYGGEVQASRDGRHFANVLTYEGEISFSTISALFRGGRVEKLVEYPIWPAAVAPRPGQAPLPLAWGDGLYLAGDAAGLFPSQETAVSTGEAVADLVKDVWADD